MRQRLSTGPGAKRRNDVLSGSIFSGPVNRAQSGSERHPTEIKQNIFGLRSAWFAGPFAYLMDPRSNDQRKALCRLCEATIHGLGMAAQRRAIDDFAVSRGAEVIARFTEVESGARSDRPELLKALHLARLTGATLIIAKLDRLSRNAAFLLALRDSGVRFLACDMPEANDLTVGIMALVAQQEREAISRRTKEALVAAKARGVKLGNPNGAAALRRAGKGGAALRQAVTANADAFARSLAPLLETIRKGGHGTLRSVAAELNARGIQTRRGGAWHVSNVRNLVRRVKQWE